MNFFRVLLISVKEYKDTQRKLARLEKFLEMMEDLQLRKLAESRIFDEMIPFENFLKEENISMDELEKLAESVELE